MPKNYTKTLDDKLITKRVWKDVTKNINAYLRLIDLPDSTIHKIGNCSLEFSNLRILNLANNKLTSMFNVQYFPHLTDLYLQGNLIRKIEGLHALKDLETLSLTNNRITTIEGLENNKKLRDLDVSYQKLPSKHALIFCPESSQALSESLKTLDVSGNNITELFDIKRLSQLEQLDFRNNTISCLDQLAIDLSEMTQLKSLDLRGNPVCSQPKFVMTIIGRTNVLDTLNGKEYNEFQVHCIKEMCLKRRTVS